MSSNAQVVAALVAGVVALAVALLNALSTRLTQVKVSELERHKADYQAQIAAQNANHTLALDRHRAEHQTQLENIRNAQHRDLELLRADLGARRAEQDAFLVYQFEARKRLYEQCEPLLFQLELTAEDGLSRIRNLAGANRRDNLGAEGWLSQNYYRLSTYYKLLAPLAVFRLLNRRLGLIDLALDTRVYKKYLVARCLYEVLGDDFDLAKACRIDGYDPHKDTTPEERDADPSRLRKQGVPEGILANAVDALVCVDAQQRDRLRTFGEFERAYFEDAPVKAAVQRIAYLFEGNFTAESRPVLWGALLAQAHLYEHLLSIFEKDDRPVPKRFEWRRDSQANEVASVAIFEGSRAYATRALEKALGSSTLHQP